MKVTVVLPYENANRYVQIWGNEENSIDCRKEPERLTRCTVSYAALELKDYLEKLEHTVEISDVSKENTINILLKYESESGDNCDFWLIPTTDSVTVKGKTRVGVLYGAYEILRIQGIRWMNPQNDFIPDKVGNIILPDEEKFFTPSFPHGRGFQFTEGMLRESELLWKWMARNRMNVVGYRPNTFKIQKKLGMIVEGGGHTEDMLQPDIVLENGKTLWEEHREWYRTDDKENALRIQFCTSNSDILDFLSESIVKKLMTEWYNLDRINMWGFDCWGEGCTCEKCKNLGNGADANFYLTAHIRNYINEQLANGKLDHDVALLPIVYEGGCTMMVPEKEIPEVLKHSGDCLLFADILRCYDHNIFDKECIFNKQYSDVLEGYKDIPIIINEYYNVSIFDCLPLLFTSTMQGDMKYFQKHASGMTYMHPPLPGWDIKNLTQYMYAHLIWDVNTDVDELLEEYFKGRYGDFAEKTKEAYRLIEESTRHIASIRSWRGIRETEICLLLRLHLWEGDLPEKELYVDDHIKDKGEAILENIVLYLDKARSIMQDLLTEAIDLYIDKMEIINGVAVNPADRRYMLTNDIIENITDDICSIQYGYDVMELMFLFTKYYNTLARKENSDEVWDQLETKVFETMCKDGPIEYGDGPAVELKTKDILDRARLKTLYYKCKKQRSNMNM